MALWVVLPPLFGEAWFGVWSLLKRGWFGVSVTGSRWMLGAKIGSLGFLLSRLLYLITFLILMWLLLLIWIVLGISLSSILVFIRLMWMTSSTSRLAKFQGRIAYIGSIARMVLSLFVVLTIWGSLWLTRKMRVPHMPPTYGGIYGILKSFRILKSSFGKLATVSCPFWCPLRLGNLGYLLYAVMPIWS